MTERISKKEPIELAWDTFVESMADRKHGLTDAFKFAWKASKPWVGLTDAEVDNIVAYPWGETKNWIKAIEAALKEKNA